MNWLTPEDVAAEVAKGKEAAGDVTRLHWWQLAHATKAELKKLPEDMDLEDYVTSDMCGACRWDRLSFSSTNCSPGCIVLGGCHPEWDAVADIIDSEDEHGNKIKFDYPAYHEAAEAMYQKTLEVK